MSCNGQLMFDIIKRQDLIILNAEKNCEGVITCHRKTVNGDKKSVLDYFLVCPQLAQFFERMLIDVDRHHVLTKYTTTRGVQKSSESDHNILYAKFVLSFSSQRPVVRRELFNFKDSDSQKKFFELTNKSENCKIVSTRIYPFKNAQINS